MYLFSLYSYKGIFIKFIKFGFIGFLSFVCDFALVYFLKEKIKLNKYLSNSISFAVVGFMNFTLNRNYTFNDHPGGYNQQLFRFFLVSGSALLLNNAITYFLTEKKEYNFYFSKVIATIIIIFWNFTLNKIFTFS